jgi:hypothetical protein
LRSRAWRGAAASLCGCSMAGSRAWRGASDGEDCGSEGLAGEDCVARARVRRGGNEGN